MSWKHKAVTLFRSPWLDLVGGLFLVGSAIFELGEFALEGVLGLELGTGHGLVAFGLIHVLKAIPEIGEGVTKIAKFEEEEKREHRSPVISRPSQTPRAEPTASPATDAQRH